MTEHKDKPHDSRCRATHWWKAPCNCDVGTRWVGNGARIDDAIAIQGIATFFARMQPVVAYCTGGYGGRFTFAMMNPSAVPTSGMAFYANPATPAAEVPDDVMRALDRMCTPLDDSWLGVKSATVQEDARCMGVIRRRILRREKEESVVKESLTTGELKLHEVGG